jgi:hypothetical protein
MAGLADYSLPAIFLMSIGALFVASEIGHHLGLRIAGEAHVSTLEAAMLGLLALIISFTFAMALSRYDGRRDALLREANAIVCVRACCQRHVALRSRQAVHSSEP